MLRMFRLRRYRVFVVFALLIVVLTVKFAKTIGGDGYIQGRGGDESELSAPIPKAPPARNIQPVTTKENGQEVHKSLVVNTGSSSSIAFTAATSPLPDVVPDISKPGANPIPTVPPVVLPNRKQPSDLEDGDISDEIHPIRPPGRQEFPIPSAVSTTIHWERQIEYFPVPTKSIIQLPAGTPTSIPRIQHKFNDETPNAKINREKRQVQVKEEFKRAWAGYKKYAWMHDELSPKSAKYRDPFCGWAATLVDTLDTLWIMGLQEEFEEAARAVEQIDFTTSPRSDIPLFETTIRYLGGLLAAYDVSGGKYKNLLDKAVELGDILLGAFDTPNRMPILYYRWKPAFASQPHRASQRSNLAELGSLSMEFTRLAQLTKDPRYYDAVARVTNALSEFQDRGTKLGSAFPDNIDASGCNQTVPKKVHEPIAKTQDILLPTQTNGPPEGYKPDAGPLGETLLDTPPVVGDIKPSDPDYVAGYGAGSLKRDLSQANISNRSTSVSLPLPKDPITGLPSDLTAAKSQIRDVVGEWDCVTQGLYSSRPRGTDKFSMGGGQDSTYEYFPKQYLLLGGREAKYKKLYLKTIADVRKWMLYRPMVPDNRDILFSGAVTTKGFPEEDLRLIAEVEHLTCFIGGMIGMGAKIFDIESDLELAKKLANGCVWAYESMPSGIMPEGAIVMPCESSEHCTWNETAYFHLLDPMADERDKLVQQYDTQKRADALAAKIEAAEQEQQDSMKDAKTDDFPIALGDGDRKARPQALSSVQSDSKIAKQQESIQKRQTESVGQPQEDKTYKSGSAPEEKSRRSEHEHSQPVLPITGTPSVDDRPGAEVPLTGDLLASPTHEGDDEDPLRPLSHQAYVKSKIKQSGLPPGFVKMKSTKYILRPEAIESVWYMYRITGDSVWQDKGWAMFESIIQATSTEYGHSAIYDVTAARNETLQIDEMESFWLAETLKYFYLLYSTPDTISLDDWVLNTEAHPFKRES